MKRAWLFIGLWACSTTSSAPPPPASPPGIGGSGGAGGSAASGPDLCALSCEQPVVEGSLVDPAIDEASGLVASAAHEGVFYVHNDSGDTPRFFAVGLNGASRGVFTLDGADALDWEDAALGPCGDTTCLYFGDIGDNPEARTEIAVHRTPEPTTLDLPDPQTLPSERVALHYEDGAHDAEAFVVDAQGRGWIIAKVDLGASGVYRTDAALAPGPTMTLRRVGEVVPPSGIASITAAARVGDRGVLVRSYTNVMFFPGATVEAALAAEPCLLPAPMEMQGETIAPVGERGYVTVSEGAGSAMNVVRCDE